MAHQFLSKKASQESSQDASKSISQIVRKLTRKLVRQKATSNRNSGEAESARENVEDQENNDPNDDFFENGDEDVSDTTDVRESKLAHDHQIALDELAIIVEALDWVNIWQVWLLLMGEW